MTSDDEPIKLIIEKTVIEAKERKLRPGYTIKEGSSPATDSTTLSAKDYFHHHMVDFVPFKHTSTSSLDILPILIGKKWNDIALGIVHAVRPSSIRVIQGGSYTLDSRSWRVTVFIDENDIIEKISQECVVGLPDGIEHGRHLRLSLLAGEITPIEYDSCFYYCPIVPDII